jgi:hypothetical protein
MNNYKQLNYLIYTDNRKRYTSLPYAWNKIRTIKYLLTKIPELPTSFIKEIKSFDEIKGLNVFVLKNSVGHSSRNVFVLDKIKNDVYIEKLRNKLFTSKHLSDIISKFDSPFLEKQVGCKISPYDIKVHVFFGKICFFYIYKKSHHSGFEKSRYDGDLNYISYNQMFNSDSFKNYSHIKENKNLINIINVNALQNIFNYSLKIFNNLDKLLYCSIDWLYDPVTGEYAFCELTPTPFLLSKPIKEKFIVDYIYKNHQCYSDHNGLCNDNNICIH